MVECVKGILDTLGHGDVNIMVFVAPFEGHITVQGALPVKGDGVVLNKVLGILFVDVDSKVIDT